MHHLQRRNVGGRDHFRQVLDGVLGKAVADEENAQRRLHIVVAARTARTRTDQVGNVVRVDRIGGLLHAQITHLLVLAVRIVNRGSAVVNPDLAARDAVDPVGRIGAVAEEHAAVGVVGDDLAVIGAAAERVGRMVGQTEQTAAAGAARRDEIAVVDAVGHRASRTRDAGDVAQTARRTARIELVAVIHTGVDPRVGIRRGDDARRARRVRGDIAVIVAVGDVVADLVGRVARRKAADARHVDRRIASVGRIAVGIGLHRAVILQAFELRALRFAEDEAHHRRRNTRGAGAVVFDLRIIDAVGDVRIAAYAGDHAHLGRAARSGDFQCARIAQGGADRQVAHRRTVQHAEQSVSRIGRTAPVGELQVFQRISLPVEGALEGVALDSQQVLFPFIGGVADRRPAGDVLHVDIAEQRHHAAGILPLRRTFARIDRVAKSRQVLDRRNARLGGSARKAVVLQRRHAAAREREVDILFEILLRNLRRALLAVREGTYPAADLAVADRDGLLVGVGADDADVLVRRGIDDVGEYGAVVLAAVDGRIVVVGLAGDARGIAVRRIARNGESDRAVIDARCEVGVAAHGRHDACHAAVRSRHVAADHRRIVRAVFELRVFVHRGDDTRRTGRLRIYRSFVDTPHDIVVAFGGRRSVGETDDAADREARGSVLGVHAVLRRDLAVIGAGEDMTIIFVSADRADDAARRFAYVVPAALNVDRRTVLAILDRGFIGISGHGSHGRHRGRGRNDRRAFADGKVPDRGALQHAEESPSRTRRSVGRNDDLQIPDRMALSVEGALKRRSRHRVGRRIGAVSDRGPRHVVHVDILRQHGFGGRLLAAGIDRRGESDQLVGRRNGDRTERRGLVEERLHDHVVGQIVGHDDNRTARERSVERNRHRLRVAVDHGVEPLGLGDGHNGRLLSLARKLVGYRNALRRVCDGGNRHRVQLEVERVENPQGDRASVAERQAEIAVAVQLRRAEYRRGVSRGLDRVARSVEYLHAVHGPAAVGIDRNRRRVTAHGELLPVVGQPRDFAVDALGPVIDAVLVELHADDRHVDDVVHRRQHDRMFDVLVVLVGDDVFPVGVLRHGGDDVAVGQIAQVRELLAERLGLGFQGFDPVFVAVDPAAQLRIVEVAATAEDHGRK